MILETLLILRTVFTAFKPQVGDIITITADGIGDTAGGSNTYAVAKWSV